MIEMCDFWNLVQAFERTDLLQQRRCPSSSAVTVLNMIIFPICVVQISPQWSFTSMNDELYHAPFYSGRQDSL